MKRTLLLSSALFKEITTASNNIEVEGNLDTVIFDAQVRYLKPILCDDFYNELITQVSGGTLTPTNTTLLNTYVRPSLAYYTLYLYYPYGWAKIRDAGVTTQNGDFYSVVSRNDLEYLRGIALDSAQSYALELRKELNDNKQTLYATYNNCDCDERGDISGDFFMVV